VTDRLTVATLNTRGIPLAGARLAERYAAIGKGLEASDIEVVNFQEVLTYYHLRLLTRRMPSFRHASFRPSAAGPAGGLVTLSLLPVAGSAYHRFGVRLDVAGLPRLTRFLAPMKGTLVTRLAAPRICIVNTHPTANWDGDWSESNRFYPIHKAQLAALARLVSGLPRPAVVCGDFNIARDSTLFSEFITGTGLADAFDGRCPPTFRAEYLSPGSSPRCIDFILVAGPINVEAADLLLADKQPLSAGPAYLSDHVGLRVRASLTPA
jgi:sphingomyelin phosphodiesterase 2